MKYRMTSNASTIGAISGKRKSWKKGQVIEAEEGEFDHLPHGYCKPLKPGKAEKADANPSGEKAQLLPSDEVDSSGVNATDSAIALAEEKGIDLSTIAGSGANGRITKGDVQAAIG